MRSPEFTSFVAVTVSAFTTYVVLTALYWLLLVRWPEYRSITFPWGMQVMPFLLILSINSLVNSWTLFTRDDEAGGQHGS